jgi:hypothetical protein
MHVATEFDDGKAPSPPYSSRGIDRFYGKNEEENLYFETSEYDPLYIDGGHLLEHNQANDKSSDASEDDELLLKDSFVRRIGPSHRCGRSLPTFAHMRYWLDVVRRFVFWIQDEFALRLTVTILIVSPF